MTQLRGLIEFSTIRDNLNFGILLLYKDCLSKEEETKLVNPSLWSEALESIILLLYRDCLNKVNESESESLVRISCQKRVYRNQTWEEKRKHDIMPWIYFIKKLF